MTSWAEVASEPLEFFRVFGETANKAIALLARFAMRKSESGRPPHELLAALIDVAMKLEERQAKADKRRRAYLPSITKLIAGVFTQVATMLPRWVGH